MSRLHGDTDETSEVLLAFGVAVGAWKTTSPRPSDRCRP